MVERFEQTTQVQTNSPQSNKLFEESYSNNAAFMNDKIGFKNSKSASQFSDVALDMFDEVDTDKNGDLTKDELKLFRIKMESDKSSRFKERVANELDAEFDAVNKLDTTDGKSGISRSDLSVLKSDWNSLKTENEIAKSLTESKAQNLFTKIKPDGNPTREDLEKALTNKDLKLSTEEKTQLAYVVANYSKINPQNNPAISRDDVVNFGMRRQIEIPQVARMQSRVSDNVIVRTQTETRTVIKTQKVYIPQPVGTGRASGFGRGQAAGQGMGGEAAAGAQRVP